MLPKSCRMKDLSHLDSLIPGLMTAVLGFNGELLTEKERSYVRVFVRLVEKAINEYKVARECVIAQVEEMQRSSEEMERDGRELYILDFVNQMENCIHTTRRLFGLFESVKREHRNGLRIDRLLRRRIEKLLDDIKNIRDFVEHIDEKIQKGETTGPVMLTISDNDESVEIAGYLFRFEDLARLLERYHKIAFKWLDDFCKKSK